MNEWLTRFNPREKIILLCAALALLVLATHAFLIGPYLQKSETLREQVTQGRADLSWMRATIVRLPTKVIAAPESDFSGSLANLIDSEVRAQNLDDFLAQMTPVSKDEIRIRYAAIDFNRLVNFIAIAAEKGLTVKDLRLNANGDLGNVDCSLVLERRA